MRLKSSMENLAMQGKLQSKEYKELNAQLKANNRTISENGEKLRLLESRLNNADKSYAQLSKQARQLRRELDNTVKSLQPQEYARLEAELAKTKEAMEQLRPKAEAVKESFFSLTRMKSAVVGFFAGIGASAGSFFANSISEARSWMSEGIRLAANADGVRRAFDKLDRPGILSELRKATKDTVNDLELMQAAVRAKDFRIPLEDLGKYLQFARLKAQQTGQSVDYLTDSIITGLGRKSLLILDNLGLSAAEVNEEMAKTGDLMAAVAAIVDRQAQAADTVATETRELNTLLGIARNEKISKEQRMEAIKRLNALSEEYLGGLRLETINTREATAAVKDYTDNLLSMARIRSANSRLEEIQKEKRALEEQRKDIHANRNLWDSFKLGLAKGFNSLSVAVKGYSDTWSEGVIHDYFAREFDQIQALNQEEKKLTQEITASQQDIIKVDTQSEAKTKDLIQAKKEEIAQAEREVASTPALLAAKNRKLQQLNEELKALQQLGTIREIPDGFASQTDKVLSALNERHEKELLKIRENKERQQQTQAQ